MILTGSSIESSLYFVAGGPRSGCTMPVMNDLSHGPRQNLAKIGKSTRLRKRELGWGSFWEGKTNLKKGRRPRGRSRTEAKQKAARHTK